MKTKTCSQCGLTKPATREYFRYRNKSIGTLRGRCIDCDHGGKRVEVVCTHCGVFFLAWPYQAKSGRPLFCCMAHAKAHRRGKPGLNAGWTMTAEQSQRNTEAQRASAKRGANHANFKGGWVNGSGYRYLSLHALSGDQLAMARLLGDARHGVAEHRLVLAMKIGRPLRKGEVAHHINGIKSDNRPQNLELRMKGEHHREHCDVVRTLADYRRENEILKAMLLAVTA